MRTRRSARRPVTIRSPPGCFTSWSREGTANSRASSPFFTLGLTRFFADARRQFAATRSCVFRRAHRQPLIRRAPLPLRSSREEVRTVTPSGWPRGCSPWRSASACNTGETIVVEIVSERGSSNVVCNAVNVAARMEEFVASRRHRRRPLTYDAIRTSIAWAARFFALKPSRPDPLLKLLCLLDSQESGAPKAVRR